MKKQNFTSFMSCVIEKKCTFQITGGRVTIPITDPNSDPDAGKQTKDEDEPASAS